MAIEERKRKYFPTWFYVVAFTLIGIWAVSVLFFAIGTLVNFLLLFLLVLVIILIVKEKKNKSKNGTP